MDQVSPTTPRSRPPFKYCAHSRWSQEHSDTAKSMYLGGKSYGDIGLAVGKTRGQVAGRLNRMNVLKTRKAKAAPVELSTAALPNRLIKVAVNPPKAKRIRLRVIESKTAVTFAELENHMCRWPLGDPKQSDFRFCGCNRLSDRTPYCSEHSTLAGRRYEKEAQTPK